MSDSAAECFLAALDDTALVATPGAGAWIGGTRLADWLGDPA